MWVRSSAAHKSIKLFHTKLILCTGELTCLNRKWPFPTCCCNVTSTLLLLYSIAFTLIRTDHAKHPQTKSAQKYMHGHVHILLAIQCMCFVIWVNQPFSKGPMHRLHLSDFASLAPVLAQRCSHEIHSQYPLNTGGISQTKHIRRNKFAPCGTSSSALFSSLFW